MHVYDGLARPSWLLAAEQAAGGCACCGRLAMLLAAGRWPGGTVAVHQMRINLSSIVLTSRMCVHTSHLAGGPAGLRPPVVSELPLVIPLVIYFLLPAVVCPSVCATFACCLAAHHQQAARPCCVAAIGACNVLQAHFNSNAFNTLHWTDNKMLL